MPPIAQLASEPLRKKEWDSVLLLCTGVWRLAEATTWSSTTRGAWKNTDSYTHGEKKFCPSSKNSWLYLLADSRSKHLCKTLWPRVCVWPSAVTSSISGQAPGIWTGSIRSPGCRRCECILPKNKKAHEVAVRGIVADGINQLVKSGGADEYVHFWNFREGKTIGRLPDAEQLHFFAIITGWNFCCGSNSRL